MAIFILKGVVALWNKYRSAPVSKRLKSTTDFHSPQVVSQIQPASLCLDLSLHTGSLVAYVRRQNAKCAEVAQITGCFAPTPPIPKPWPSFFFQESSSTPNTKHRPFCVIYANLTQHLCKSGKKILWLEASWVLLGELFLFKQTSTV